jgi:hypothetical protein
MDGIVIKLQNHFVNTSETAELADMHDGSSHFMLCIT